MEAEVVDDQFRRLSIHPTIDDLIRESTPDLSPNLCDKAYRSNDHYLDTHFRLLREELVRPLVESVNKLKQILNTKDKDSDNQIDVNFRSNQQKSWKEKIENEVEANVYHDIRLILPYVDFSFDYGMVLKFTFDYSSLQDIDLVDCPHLMDGNLLCLSPNTDNFNETIFFGIITKSEVGVRLDGQKDRLWNFCLKLDIDSDKCDEFFDLLAKPSIRYVGIESPSYYEGFRHTLKTLKTTKDFLLKKYIVDLKQDISPPPYLLPKQSQVSYDISCIQKISPLVVETKDPELNSDEEYHSDSAEDSGTGSASTESEENSPLSSVELLKYDVFAKSFNRDVAEMKNSSTFDTRQFDAFFAAITKQLCVIEGPPGTGKTFVGLKIVKCLLDNIKVWNEGSEYRPILVVCYKNHALDQFLEGIIKFNENVVRIGGKSESKELDDYKLNLKEWKFRDDLKEKKEGLDPEVIKAHKEYNKLWFRIRRLEEEVANHCDIVTKSFDVILTLNEIEPYVWPKRLMHFFENFSGDDKALYYWLNPERDANFDELCKKMLKIKIVKERFDNIDLLVSKNIMELGSIEKWILYMYWRYRLLQDYRKKLNGLSKTIAEELVKLRLKRVKFRKKLCKDAQVIGLTITGAAKYKDLVEAFNPRIMIIEEAAEVLESHVVAAMSSNIDHVIFIGDHKQLRPLTNVRELTDKYFLDISLFERLVKNKLPFVALEEQHRMHPCIAQLLKVGNIYDFLRNGEKVKNYPPIKFTFGKNMYFLDHQNIEDSNISRNVPDKSRSNLYEAKIVVQLVKYFLLHNYSEEDITVLTTYNAQLRLIKQLMFEDEEFFVRKVDAPEKPNSKKGNNEDIKDEKELKVRVSSVDGFQGEENNIIIISFVRSSKMNSIGFLDNKNRINVALSRARHGLFCVGNFTIMAKEEKSKMWSDIVNHLNTNQWFGDCFTIGCDCTKERHISMPGQFELLNLQIRNGMCTCRLSKK